MIAHLSAVRWTLLFLSLVALISSANAGDDKETRRLASKLYVTCLSSEGGRIILKTENTRPNAFEKIASVLCKDDEKRLRTILQLDMLQAQLKRKKILNEDAQRLVSELIEQTIQGMRRAVVVLYAAEFDRRHPGARSCVVKNDEPIDEKLKYLCAIQD